MMIEVAQQLDMPLSISSAEEPEQSVVHVNHAFCKLTGYTKEELEGRATRVGRQVYRAGGEACYTRGVSQGRGRHCTVHLHNKQMNPARIASAQPVFDDERRHVYTVGMQLMSKSRLRREWPSLSGSRTRCRARWARALSASAADRWG